MSSSHTETLIEVAMPKMGISVSEGTILEWRKQPGDWIEADETIADVTTDKVDVEIPAPASGRLARIIAEPGDTVPVGEPIAEIDAEAKPGEAHPEESAVRSPQSAARGGRSQQSAVRRAPGGLGWRNRSVGVRVARGAADRRQARRRPRAGPGHRDRRASAQDGRARVCRGEWGRPRPGEAGTGPALRVPVQAEESAVSSPQSAEVAEGEAVKGGRTGGRRASRADDPDAADDRQAHARQPAHVGALHDDRRGRHVARRRAEQSSRRR